MTQDKSRVLCKYYQHGACRYKNGECPFSHDTAVAPSLVCKFYLQGCCAYGAACRYDHIKPEWSRRQADAPASQASSSRPSAGPSSAPQAPASAPTTHQQPSPSNPWDGSNQTVRSAGQTQPALQPAFSGSQDSSSGEDPIDQLARLTLDDLSSEDNNTAETSFTQLPATLSPTASIAQPAGASTQGGAAAPGLPHTRAWHNTPAWAPTGPSGTSPPPHDASQAATAWQGGAAQGEDAGTWGEQYEGYGGEGDAEGGWGEEGGYDSWAGYYDTQGGEGDTWDEQGEGDDGMGAWGHEGQEGEAGYWGDHNAKGGGVDESQDTEGGGAGLGDLSPEELAGVPLCSNLAAYGVCYAGDKCRFVHGDLCETCHRQVLHPYNTEEAEQHRTVCRARHDKLQARLRSADIECCICMEKVLGASNPADRRFGLLTCDHPFCLKCIRTWRANTCADVDSAVRTCPVCRVPSHFITPSLVWPSTPEDKERIVEGYKQRLAQIDCQHFDRGQGNCPFGTSCFYRHMYPDGRLQSREVSLRTALSGTGGVRVLTNTRLSDFLETEGAQRALAAGSRNARVRLRARRRDS